MKKLTAYLFIVFMLAHCSNNSEGVPRKSQLQAIDSIKAKRDLYLSLVKEVSDEHGFIEYSSCDSLLFTALAAFSGVSNIDLLAAYDEKTYRWYRNPSKDCHDKYLSGERGAGTSKSDISKDMFTGLFFAYSDLAKRVVAETWKYGKDHNWIMGRGEYSRTWLSINLQRTLAIIANKPMPDLPDLWVMPKDSHSDTHISVLHILLRGHLKGKITKDMFAVIKKAKNKYPQNPFFLLAYSLYSAEEIDLTYLYEVLQDERYFPSDKLPNSDERCGHWLWQHEFEKYREPCPEESRIYSGIDLALIVKLLEK